MKKNWTHLNDEELSDEKMLSDILNEPSVPYFFSDSKIEQILKNVSSSNIRLKQYIQDWLKCKTDDERHILREKTYLGMSKTEIESFSLAFHTHLLRDFQQSKISV